MTPQAIVEHARRLEAEQLAALISDLQALQAARWATAHQTVVIHETGAAA